MKTIIHYKPVVGEVEVREDVLPCFNVEDRVLYTHTVDDLVVGDDIPMDVIDRIEVVL